jgi:hypothetical protein
LEKALASSVSDHSMLEEEIAADQGGWVPLDL